MKKLAAILLCASVAFCQQRPKGIDVSGHQPNVDWHRVRVDGIEFVYIKATESTTFKNVAFSKQYTGATKVGIIRGSYHFALPDKSSGAAQADFFLHNGGGWSGDGKTLPGAVDLEYNPYGPPCYGLNPAAMVNWILDFSNTYHSKTTRYPVIYTTTDWWQKCTGNSARFGSQNPLWIARYASTVGPLPGGWSSFSFWQYSDSAAPNPGDGDLWNGSLDSLTKFARG